MENDAEIFLAHYTWKVAEKGFKMACLMNKLAMINSSEIIENFFLLKSLQNSDAHYTCMCITLDKIE
jgi:hypothetical protein